MIKNKKLHMICVVKVMFLISNTYAQSGFDYFNQVELNFYKPNLVFKSNKVSSISVYLEKKGEQKYIVEKIKVDSEGYITEKLNYDKFYINDTEFIKVNRNNNEYVIKRMINKYAILRGKDVPFYAFWTPYLEYFERFEETPSSILNIVNIYSRNHDFSFVSKTYFGDNLIDTGELVTKESLRYHDSVIMKNAIIDSFYLKDTLKVCITSKVNDSISEVSCKFLLDNLLIRENSSLFERGKYFGGNYSINSYDLKNRLLTKNYYTSDDLYNSGKIYKYNDKDSTYIEFSDELSQDHKIDFHTKYDFHGNKLEEANYHYSGMQIKTIYSYLPNGLLKLKSKWIGDKNEENYYYEYEYNKF